MSDDSFAPLEGQKEHALLYLNKGISVFPLKNPEHRSDGDLEKEKTEGVTERKEPDVISLDEFKKALVSREQVLKWFKEKPNMNFGAFCGRVSGNLLVIDEDGEDASKRINDNVLQNMQSNVRTALLNTMVVTTGSGGRHYYLILNDEIMKTMPSSKIWIGEGEHQEISLFANNHYVVGAGSRHPNSRTYEWNGKRPIPITKEELFEFVRLVAKNPDMVLTTLERNYSSGNSSSNNSGPTTTTTTTTKVSDNNNTIAEERLIKSDFGKLYQSGSRNDWWIEASGLLRRHRIPRNDAISICRKICHTMGDEQIEDRVKTMIASYDNKEVVEVAGWKFLEDFASTHTSGVMSAEKFQEKIKQMKESILSAIYEFRLEIIKRDNAWVLSSGGNKELYIVTLKSTHDFEPTENNVYVPIRRVQMLEVKRRSVDLNGRVDNAGRGDITSLEYGEVLINAAPAGVVSIYEDPLFGGVRYRIRWEHVDQSTGEIQYFTKPDGKNLLLKSELEEWLQKESSLVRKPKRLGEALDAVISGYENKSGYDGWVDKRIEIHPKGFFWYQGKIVASKVDVPLEPLSEEDCKLAADMIIELQQKFFNGNNGRDRLRLAHYLKHHLVLPYDYVRKQRELTRHYDFVPRVDLCGWHGTGKSEYAKIGIYLRGLSERDISLPERSVKTQPRLIHEMGKTTMTLVAEEVDFLRDPRIGDGITATLKDSADKLDANVLSKDRSEIPEPLLGPVFLTHNNSPVIEGGMSRRYIIDSFTKEDVKYERNDPALVKRAQEYASYVEKNLSKFRTIGYFADQYIINHPEVLEDTYINIGVKVLSELFQRGGVIMPAWLKETIDDVEKIKSGVSNAYNSSEYGESYKSEILGAIKQYVNDAFSSNNNIYQKTLEIAPSDVKFEERLRWLGQNNRLSGMFYNEKEEEIYFTAGVKSILKKYHIDVDRVYQSLENFASICGFTPDKVRLNPGDSQTRVAIAKVASLVNDLTGSEMTDAKTELKICGQ